MSFRNLRSADLLTLNKIKIRNTYFNLKLNKVFDCSIKNLSSRHNSCFVDGATGMLSWMNKGRRDSLKSWRLEILWCIKCSKQARAKSQSEPWARYTTHKREATTQCTKELDITYLPSVILPLILSLYTLLTLKGFKYIQL